MRYEAHEYQTFATEYIESHPIAAVFLLMALIHPASAGHGLNLQSGGCAMAWFGLTWSLELYQQTVARLWRQRQDSGTVVVQHIITKGTIDERIMKALSEKDATQNALIDAVKAVIGAKR